MKPYIHHLDANKDRSFLEEGRIDPITHELLQPGDEIIICADEKIAFLAKCWNGRCPLCGKTETLPTIPKTSPLRFGNNYIMEEKMDFMTKFLSIVICILYIIVIGLILYSDYNTNFIMDISSVFIGSALIALISSSVNKNKEKIFHTFNNIFNKIPSLIILFIGILSAYLSFRLWNFFWVEFRTYINQIIIVGIVGIAFSMIRVYILTKEYKQYIALPCIGIFWGFTLGTIVYFTFKQTIFFKSLIQYGVYTFKQLMSIKM